MVWRHRPRRYASHEQTEAAGRKAAAAAAAGTAARPGGSCAVVAANMACCGLQAVLSAGSEEADRGEGDAAE
eukprot:364938-Chlamydomonas_euryale.AAC.26